jgi:hypothetical protein
VDLPGGFKTGERGLLVAPRARSRAPLVCRRKRRSHTQPRERGRWGRAKRRGWHSAAGAAKEASVRIAVLRRPGEAGEREQGSRRPGAPAAACGRGRGDSPSLIPGCSQFGLLQSILHLAAAEDKGVSGGARRRRRGGRPSHDFDVAVCGLACTASTSEAWGSTHGSERIFTRLVGRHPNQANRPHRSPP